MANLIAAGQAAATGTFTLAGSERKTVTINATGASVPNGVNFGIFIDGTGDDVLVGTLNCIRPGEVVDGPGVFIVKRPDITQYGVNVACDAD